MMLLAIDPGPVESAYVCWTGERINYFGKTGNDQLLHIASAQSVHHVVIEMIASYGMPVGAEVFETCVWIGRFVQAWGGEQYVDRIKRAEVKSHLCHSDKEKDGNVRQAVIDSLGAQ